MQPSAADRAGRRGSSRWARRETRVDARCRGGPRDRTEPERPLREDVPGTVIPIAEASDALLEALPRVGAQDEPVDARDDVRMGRAPGPLGLILSPGRNRDSTLPAGTTFVGQFIDHDITFDETSQLGVPRDPEESKNSRQPALNLDSVYGGGFGDAALVLPDGRMRVERCDPSNPASREDLPVAGRDSRHRRPAQRRRTMIAGLRRRRCCSTTTRSRSRAQPTRPRGSPCAPPDDLALPVDRPPRVPARDRGPEARRPGAQERAQVLPPER